MIESFGSIIVAESLRFDHRVGEVVLKLRDGEPPAAMRRNKVEDASAMKTRLNRVEDASEDEEADRLTSKAKKAARTAKQAKTLE